MRRSGWKQVMAVGLGALFALPAFARHATGTIAVSATVSPSALVGFEISAQPLTITAKDIERGYVDVVMKSRMQVRTAHGSDAQPAFVLGMEPRNDLFRSMAFTSSPVASRGEAGAKAAQPTVERSTDEAGAHVAEFRYRFELAQAARPGQYETAISVAVDL